MARVLVEVRKGDGLFEVTVYADSISEAVGIARGRFPGHVVRVVFPIDGDEFFGGRGTETFETDDLGQRRLMPGRVAQAGMDRCERAAIHRSRSRERQVDA